jgi:multiple sugar transport system ATP-binding protein
MASLSLENVVKIFPGNLRAVDDLTLDVADGRRIALVGPSGSGKSTVLRLIAGLEQLTAGKIAIDGRPVDHLPPQKRGVAMVFQHHVLYPHLSVYGNLAFALKLRRLGKSEIRTRVAETAAMLGIADLLARRPWELSGGQRQRVALGRALLRRPGIFLLDEPLSNLDAGLRDQMRREIVRLHEQSPATTMIYVTHDQTEAMTVGRPVVVLCDGRVQQIADPETLYNSPANRFVASLIGNPAMNFFSGRIVPHGGQLAFEAVGCAQRTDTSPLPLLKDADQSPLPLGEGQGEGSANAGCAKRTQSPDGETLFSWPVSDKWQNALAPYRGHEITLGVRPEHLLLGQTDSLGNCLKIPAVVETIESLGAECYLHLRAGPQLFICRAPSNHGLSLGDGVTPAASDDRLYFFDARAGKRVK